MDRYALCSEQAELKLGIPAHALNPLGSLVPCSYSTCITILNKKSLTIKVLHKSCIVHIDIHIANASHNLHSVPSSHHIPVANPVTKPSNANKSTQKIQPCLRSCFELSANHEKTNSNMLK